MDILKVKHTADGSTTSETSPEVKLSHESSRAYSPLAIALLTLDGRAFQTKEVLTPLWCTAHTNKCKCFIESGRTPHVSKILEKESPDAEWCRKIESRTLDAIHMDFKLVCS